MTVSFPFFCLWSNNRITLLSVDPYYLVPMIIILERAKTSRFFFLSPKIKKFEKEKCHFERVKMSGKPDLLGSLSCFRLVCRPFC